MRRKVKLAAKIGRTEKKGVIGGKGAKKSNTGHPGGQKWANMRYIFGISENG